MPTNQEPNCYKNDTPGIYSIPSDTPLVIKLISKLIITDESAISWNTAYKNNDTQGQYDEQLKMKDRHLKEDITINQEKKGLMAQLGTGQYVPEYVCYMLCKESQVTMVAMTLNI